MLGISPKRKGFRNPYEEKGKNIVSKDSDRVSSLICPNPLAPLDTEQITFKFLIRLIPTSKQF